MYYPNQGIIKNWGGGVGCGSVVEHFPSMWKALGPISSIVKSQRVRKEREGGERGERGRGEKGMEDEKGLR